MSSMTKDDMKQEALKRMHKLKLMKECVGAFEESNEVWVSENNGILYNLAQQESILTKIKELEDKDHILVYHVIKTNTEFGMLISFLCVSPYKDEWDFDWRDINDNLIFCYVLNLSDDWCSEYGSIEYKSINGGLIRTA